MKKFALVSLIMVVLLVGGYFLMMYSYIVTNNELNASLLARQQDRNSVISNTFAVIAQKTQITAAARDSFEKIYPEIFKAKGLDKGGALMKWVQESAPPSFDINANFKDLSTAVEAQRNSFTQAQKLLIASAQDYKVFSENPLARWFVSDTPRVTMRATQIQVEYRNQDAVTIPIIVIESASETIASGVETSKNLDLGLKK